MLFGAKALVQLVLHRRARKEDHLLFEFLADARDARVRLLENFEGRKGTKPNHRIGCRKRQPMRHALRVRDKDLQIKPVLEAVEYLIALGLRHVARNNIAIHPTAIQKLLDAVERVNERHEYDYLTVGRLNRVVQSLHALVVVERLNTAVVGVDPALRHLKELVHQDRGVHRGQFALGEYRVHVLCKALIHSLLARTHRYINGADDYFRKFHHVFEGEAHARLQHSLYRSERAWFSHPFEG